MGVETMAGSKRNYSDREDSGNMEDNNNNSNRREYDNAHRRGRESSGLNNNYSFNDNHYNSVSSSQGPWSTGGSSENRQSRSNVRYDQASFRFNRDWNSTHRNNNHQQHQQQRRERFTMERYQHPGDTMYCNGRRPQGPYNKPPTMISNNYPSQQSQSSVDEGSNSHCSQHDHVVRRNRKRTACKDTVARKKRRQRRKQATELEKQALNIKETNIGRIFPFKNSWNDSMFQAEVVNFRYCGENDQQMLVYDFMVRNVKGSNHRPMFGVRHDQIDIVTEAKVGTVDIAMYSNDRSWFLADLEPPQEQPDIVVNNNITGIGSYVNGYFSRSGSSGYDGNKNDDGPYSKNGNENEIEKNTSNSAGEMGEDNEDETKLSANTQEKSGGKEKNKSGTTDKQNNDDVDNYMPLNVETLDEADKGFCSEFFENFQKGKETNCPINIDDISCLDFGMDMDQLSPKIPGNMERYNESDQQANPPCNTIIASHIVHKNKEEKNNAKKPCVPTLKVVVNGERLSPSQNDAYKATQNYQAKNNTVSVVNGRAMPQTLKSNTRNSNEEVFLRLLGRLDAHKSSSSHYLAIFVPNKELKESRRGNCVGEVNFAAVKNLKDMVAFFEHIYIMQRNKYKEEAEFSNCTFYIAKNLHENIHCMIGSNAVQAIKDRVPGSKITLIGENQNFFEGGLDWPGYVRIGEDGRPDLGVWKRSESHLIFPKKNTFGKCALKGVVQRALKALANNKTLMEHIITKGSVPKTRKRGAIVSYHFGSTLSNAHDYTLEGKRASVGGGVKQPTLHGYNIFDTETRNTIRDYDISVLKYLLPAMNFPHVFQDPGPRRRAHNKLIKEKLLASNVEYESMTFPEGGTFIIYPTNSNLSPMEILMPHVDSLNDGTEGFNYVTCGNGIFKLDEIRNDTIRAVLKDRLNVTSTFEFAFLRYSRKVVGDMDLTSSKSNQLQIVEKNGSPALRKIFHLQKQANTEWDYDYIVGRRDIQKYIALYTKCQVGKNPKCNYKHGGVITDEYACADKNCHYSPAFDMILSLYAKWKIDKWDDIVSIPLFFVVYTNGTPLFMQALESLLTGKHCGNTFNGFDEACSIDCKGLPKWAYILSRELLYAKKLQSDNPDDVKSAATSNNRSQGTGPNMNLPHLDIHCSTSSSSSSSSKRFVAILEAVKKIIKDIWEDYDAEIAKIGRPSGNSFRAMDQKLVFEQCSAVMVKLTKVRGIGNFSAVCLIQFFAGLEINPPIYNYFGYVAPKLGPYKFLDDNLSLNIDSREGENKNKRGRGKEVEKLKTEYFNREIFEISRLSRRWLNPQSTMLEVENLCCEIYRQQKNRGTKKTDVKYSFGFRSKISDGNFVGGLQNFFFLRFDTKTKMMRMHILYARGDSAFSLKPLCNYIQIDGRNMAIDFKHTTEVGLPFNLVNCEEKKVRLYKGECTVKKRISKKKKKKH